MPISSDHKGLLDAISEIGADVTGKYVIVNRGRLVSGNTPLTFFVSEEMLMGTLTFDPDTLSFYLAESPGETIGSIHDIEFDCGRLFISGWPTTTDNWRWIRWIVEF